MIEFIKDIDLGNGTVIKKGMTAHVFSYTTKYIETLAGTLCCPPRIGFDTFWHPEWRDILKLQPGEAAIFDLDSRFPKDSYKEIADV